MKKIFVLFATCLLFSGIAFADIPAPIKPTPTAQPKEIVKKGDMLIGLSYSVDEPTLVISPEMFEKLRAEVENNRGGGGSSVAVVSGSDFNRTQTIVSGLFISLAFVFGGVWLVKNRGKVSKTGVAIVVFAILGMATTLVTANIRAPRNVGLSQAILSNEMRVDNAYAQGKIKIVVGEVRSRQDIELLLPEKRGE